MKVLSLNATDGGTRLYSHFFSRLGGLAPDVVTLQEMRRQQVGDWRRGLAERGYQVVDSFELADRFGVALDGGFRLDGLLLASRWPFEVLDPTRWDLPWPERALSAVVAGPGGKFAVHTVHVPNASTGITLYRKDREAGADRLAKKTETFEGVFAGLAESPELPKVLTGDFNTPRFERPDGEVGYWEESCPAALRPVLRDRWLAAERNVIQGLGKYGMYDVFRGLHGYEREAFSWEATNKVSRYRYDHVFASEVFKPVACEYLHEFRLNSSHHAGILADLELR